jgi:nucleotide-binding universal stress UspA family protein
MNAPILVGYDGSDGSRDALALAKGLARISGSPLLLAWIESVGPLDVPYETILEPIQLRAEEALREVAHGLHAQEFEVGTRVGLLGSAPQGIHELAEEESAELVVVGSSHRGRVGRILAGTVGTRLLHGSPCPVAVAPRGLADAGEWRPAVIGVAYDGSREAHAALEQARHLAATARATLKVIAVAELMSSAEEAIDPETLRQVSQKLAHEWLREASDVLRDETTVVTQLAVGEPGPELLTISEGLDLLVLGSRGYGPLRRVLLGSVSSYLVERCRCPVIVAPRGSLVSARPDGHSVEAPTALLPANQREQ